MLDELSQGLVNKTEARLKLAIQERDIPSQLSAAMSYSLLGAGKRIRALLCYAAGQALNAPMQRLECASAALECLHCYSLIHDDLPAMDDDDLRRGKATSHIKFDEATAILAGDALQAIAYDLICSDPVFNDTQARKLCNLLAQSSGAVGMVGGQMLDILATQEKLELTALENVHRRKTGALISAAVVSGALCSDNPAQDQIDALGEYGECIGLAFQVVDDILDIESSTAELGKPSGADIALEKSTYPALIGLDASKQLAEKLYQQAIASLAPIGDNSDLLKNLATLIIHRRY